LLKAYSHINFIEISISQSGGFTEELVGGLWPRQESLPDCVSRQGTWIWSFGNAYTIPASPAGRHCTTRPKWGCKCATFCPNQPHWSIFNSLLPSPLPFAAIFPGILSISFYYCFVCNISQQPGHLPNHCIAHNIMETTA